MGNKWIEPGLKTLSPKENPFLHVERIPDPVIPNQHILEYVPSASRTITVSSYRKRVSYDAVKLLGIFQTNQTRTSYRPEKKETRTLEIIAGPDNPPKPVETESTLESVREELRLLIKEISNKNPNNHQSLINEITVECGRYWSDVVVAMVSEIVHEVTGKGPDDAIQKPTAEGRMKRIHRYRWKITDELYD